MGCNEGWVTCEIGKPSLHLRITRLKRRSTTLATQTSHWRRHWSKPYKSSREEKNVLLVHIRPGIRGRRFTSDETSEAWLWECSWTWLLSRFLLSYPRAIANLASSWFKCWIPSQYHILYNGLVIRRINFWRYIRIRRRPGVCYLWKHSSSTFLIIHYGQIFSH